MKHYFTSIAPQSSTVLDSFEKGKRAQVGEIRTWSGEKYQRTTTGWKYLGKDTGKSETQEDLQPSPIKFKKPLTEETFTGWPDWDEAGDINTPDQAIREIKASAEWKKYKSFQDFYWNNDNLILSDYLNSDLELDDKRYIAASLGLTGMLSTDVPGFEFTEPVKELSLYDDDLGNEDISITFAYDPWKIPKEIKDIGRIDKKTHLFCVDSQDMEQGLFESRAHGKIPKIGLLWAYCSGDYSATVPGYWVRDAEAKRDMMQYCGLEEFKNGNLVNNG